MGNLVIIWCLASLSEAGSGERPFLAGFSRMAGVRGPDHETVPLHHGNSGMTGRPHSLAPTLFNFGFAVEQQLGDAFGMLRICTQAHSLRRDVVEVRGD
jgi:hypothetical protein